MPTKHHHFLYGYELDSMPWHGITAETPPSEKFMSLGDYNKSFTDRALGVTIRVPHIGRYAPYALLAITVLLLVFSSPDLRAKVIEHVIIGVGATLCGIIGRRVCQHRLHQVATTLALLLLEAWATVNAIG